MPFSFDLDITRAQTIPARLYNDPLYLDLEVGQIFGRTWQLVGRTAQLEGQGAYITADIANESIVIVRDGEALRGFHNICLHRAGPVAQGCGKRQTMQCKYHGWTYNLRGELVRAPGMEGTADFTLGDFRLLPVQVATWGPLVFANLDLKAPPLAHFIEDIPERVARFGAEQMQFVMSREWRIDCNWKVYVDNYLEGYHVAMVHPGLHKELDTDHYVVEPHRYYSRQFAPLRPLAPHATDRKYIPREGDDEAHYYWIYPNWMLNIYQGQLQTNIVIPMDHRTTLVRFDWYALVPPAEHDAEWTRLIDFSFEIQDEDVAICEAVQRNLRSRAYDRGRYSATKENGVHHFHSLIHESLS